MPKENMKYTFYVDENETAYFNPDEMKEINCECGATHHWDFAKHCMWCGKELND